MNAYLPTLDKPSIARSELNPATNRYIAREEKYLDRKCRKIWRATNPKGETFTFANFCRNHDRLIVTLETYVPRVGWITTH